ncbi:hypothetical protein IVA95_15605 [Bradyrhizobium sp. 157]|uniref:hypothetical protein n=1 Tax=Bradyrhizobium sp. 157 TaxID=2782631 RepID=UPI001FF97EE8|nr:hypothetical protein [Bradyrhizobium sp. 157]MCK1638987.1 hypothetical protein [Bradyrhizobium sp. 157]
MNNWFRTALSALALAVVPNVCLSQESCLPALQPDIVDLTSDTQQRLIVLDKMLSSRAEARDTGIAAKYEGYAFDYNNAKKVASTMSRLLHVDYSNDEKHTMFVSRLSGNALEAYLSCLRNKSDLSYSFAGDILGARSFFIKINWHPTYRPQGDEQKGTVQLTQGKFVKTGNSEMNFTIRPTDSIFVAVDRDEFERSQIAIMIDGKVQVVNLPPRSRFRIVSGIKRSTDKLETGTVETSGDIGKTLCVQLENTELDSALVPGSFKFVFARKQVSRVVVQENNPVTESDRSACSHLGVVFQTVFKSYAYVTAHAEALVFFAAPVTATAPAPAAPVAAAPPQPPTPPNPTPPNR